MQFDKNKFKVLKLPLPIFLLWILNPAMVIAEIVMGIRLPEVILVDKDKTKPLNEPQFIPCPECNNLHDVRLWTHTNGFGHWLGLVCPSCGGIIPCVRNALTIAIQVFTFPIWYLLRMLFAK
ncbi:MAG: hypothetical protein GY750_12870 [Lentisphaerae bacterium]|nr:hypothetical protein [Lentisphaerota bacterium]MCP4102306.1 hypothetical protein [Lentisphaerota bacterium]